MMSNMNQQEKHVKKEDSNSTFTVDSLQQCWMKFVDELEQQQENSSNSHNENGAKLKRDNYNSTVKMLKSMRLESFENTRSMISMSQRYYNTFKFRFNFTISYNFSKLRLEFDFNNAFRSNNGAISTQNIQRIHIVDDPVFEISINYWHIIFNHIKNDTYLNNIDLLLCICQYLDYWRMALYQLRSRVYDSNLDWYNTNGIIHFLKVLKLNTCDMNINIGDNVNEKEVNQYFSKFCNEIYNWVVSKQVSDLRIEHLKLKEKNEKFYQTSMDNIRRNFSMNGNNRDLLFGQK